MSVSLWHHLEKDMWTLGFPRAQWGLPPEHSPVSPLPFGYCPSLFGMALPPMENYQKNVREPGSLALFGIANFVTSSAS